LWLANKTRQIWVQRSNYKDSQVKRVRHQNLFLATDRAVLM